MAIKAPKVQTLAQAMAELNPAYSASKNVINQRISGLGAKYDAQRAGINAERGQGFAAINNQATGRGGSFSGIPIDEQATYLSTKYLPGMQMADFQQNQEGLTYKGQLADIDKEVRTTAIGRVDKQKSDLNSWNSARAAEQAAAREAEKSRQFQAKQAAAQRNFQASQAAKERAFTASQNTMSRAAKAASNAASTPSADSLITSFLASNSVKGKVSPSVWTSAAKMAYDNGIKFGGNNGFASQYWQYADTKNWQNYLGDRGGTNNQLKRYYK